MSYSQEVYDAVRSKIQGGNVSEVVEQVLRESFDISHQVHMVASCYQEAAAEQQRPCVIHKPTISLDGNMWSVLLGDNIMEGVVGFGKTPAHAMDNFDCAYWGKPPAHKTEQET